MWANYILVFLVVGIGDIFWTRLMQSVAVDNGHKAGLNSVFIIMASVYLNRAYNHDGWYVIPAIMGAYLGTRLPIEYKKWRLQNASE
jgi:hypothetical protein